MVDLSPIEVFVAESFKNPEVSKILSSLDLNIDLDTVKNIVTEDFREMGILFVEPRVNDILYDSLIRSLLNSKRIKKLCLNYQTRTKMKQRPIVTSIN